VEPSSVALTTSRGWESYRSKLAMRFTVIVSDLLFTLPAVHLFVRAFYGREKGGNGARNAWATALILLAPGPILIDHGHFQYNNWSLGLTTYAVAAILDGKHVCRVRAVHAIAVPQADVALPRTGVLRALIRQMSQVRVYFL
jgi:alpha-1,3-glucosyltransferase